MNNTLTAIGSIIAAILGVAIVAVLVSRSAQTSQVISSAGGALSMVIGTAVSPVTGNYPGPGAAGFGGFSPSSFMGGLNPAQFGGGFDPTQLLSGMNASDLVGLGTAAMAFA